METNDQLLEGEVAKLHGLLSIQSSPIKETAFLQVGGLSSSKTLVHIEVQSAAYDKENRTLQLRVYPEVDPSTAKSRLQLLLAQPLQLELFFPESPADPPLLFGSTDGAAYIAERVNDIILPIDRSSLMHALSVIISMIKAEVDAVWNPSSDFLAAFATEIRSCLERHSSSSSSCCPRSADLLLSLLSMSKGHHPTIRFPIPRYFYQDGGTIDQSGVLAALSSIPPLKKLITPGDRTLEEGLPFQSCVLLNHLLCRLRVSLAECKIDNDPLLSRCFRNGVERPDLAFKVVAPEDMRFAGLAAKRGKRVGYHGSPPENFFSIVSLGLKNLSGTKGMRNGAAFGEGCYLAGDLNVARQFGGWGRQVWRNSSFGSTAGGSTSRPLQFAYQIIALCEFIDLPDYRKTMQNSNKEGSAYYVISEDHHLVVRALLLFKDPALRDNITARRKITTTTTTTTTTAVTAGGGGIPGPATVGTQQPTTAGERAGVRLGDSSVFVLLCIAAIVGIGLWVGQQARSLSTI